MKRIISVILSLCMILAAVPAMQVSAITAEECLQYLTYEIVDGEVTITGCEEGVTEIVIPDTIEGYPVTIIGESAFYGITTLVSVVFPSTLVTIEKSAFENTSIDEVVFYEGLETIRERAFYNAKVTTASFPLSLTEIEAYAFHIPYVHYYFDIFYAGSVVEWRNINIGECNFCFNNYYYAVEHTHTVVETVSPVEPTETEFGFTIGEECTTCGEVLSVSEVLPPTSDERYKDLRYRVVDGEIVVTGAKENAKSVVIPYGVSKIGNSAFSDRDYIKEVSIPDSVTYISAYAFYGCDGLEALVIPDSVTEIEYAAIYNCENLGYVKLPANLTKIPSSFLVDCPKLRYVRLPESITYIDYSFAQCESLTAIEIPKNVEYIHWESLKDNYYYSYGADIYYSGTEEEWNNIDGSYYVGFDLYFGDTHEHTVETIPAKGNTCDEYGHGVVEKCTVCGIYLNDLDIIEPTGHNFVDGICSVCGLDKDLACLKYKIIDGEAIITGCDPDVTSIKIPSTIEGYPVTKIGYGAFNNCSSLNQIYIPESIKIIENDAFLSCWNLRDVYYEASIIEWKSISVDFNNGNYYLECAAIHYGVEHVFENGICVDCGISKTEYDLLFLSYTITDGQAVITDCDQSVKSISIPATIEGYSVTAIEDYAFAYCYSLEEVIIPEGVKSIGLEAFYNCQSLKKVTLPVSIDTIEDYAFSGCYELSDVYYAGSIVEWSQIKVDYDNNYNLKSVTMHFAVEHVFEDGFCVDCGLAEVEYNTMLLSYEIVNGEVVITDCSVYVTSMVIPSTIEGYPVTAIGNYTFSDCYSLEEVIIPEGVKRIGDYVFGWCHALKEVTIPLSIETIGNNAFCACYNMTDIYYAASRVEWNKIDYDFDNDYYVSDVTIHYAVEHTHNIDYTPGVEPTATEFGFTAIQICIECGDVLEEKTPLPPTNDERYALLTYAFVGEDIGVIDYDDSAEYLVIPEGVTVIGDYAFAYVDYMTLNNYGLKGVELPESLRKIGYGAFARCVSLKEIVIPESVTYLDGETFWCCESLEYVLLPDSLEYIGSWTFAGCSSLKDIEIPEYISRISTYAFSGCNMIRIDVPDNVEIIDFGVFGYNDNLVKINLPDGLTSFSFDAVRMCPNLESIEIPVSVVSLNFTEKSEVLKNIYYAGTEDQWNNVEKFGDYSDVTVYFADTHTHTETIVPATEATCTEFGYPEGVTKCADCGLYLSDWEPVYAKGHTFVSDICVDCGIDEMLSYLEYEISDGRAMITYCDPFAEKIIIPETIEGCPVTSIEMLAFDDCHRMTEIVIPKSVTYIGSFAFMSSVELKTVYYTGTEEEWNNVIIDNENWYLTNIVTDYVVPEVVYGDANGDGVLNSFDVIIIKKYLAGINEEGTSTKLMDVNRDGRINAKDLLFVKKTIMGV